MRQDQIEMESISHLKLKLGRISSVKVNFFENDKTPFYDGEISIYDVQDNEQLNKKLIVNEVRVQIKGTTDQKVLMNAKDSVSVTDLNGFSKLQGGGCFYFIVCISNDGLEKIYYYDFQPFELKRILDEKGQQGSVTIDLKEFPSNHDEIVNLFKTFAINLDYQSRDVLYADVTNLTTEKINIKFHGPHEDYKKYLNSGAVVYVNTPENISIPIGQVVPNSFMYLSTLTLQLENGEKLLGVSSKDRQNNITLTIDDTLKIIYDKDKIHFNFKLDNNFTIEEIINCINNLESIFKNGFYIGEKFEKHIEINRYFSHEKLKELIDLYDFRDEMNEILELLNKLHVNKDIKYHELKNEDKIKLHNLLVEFKTHRPNGKIIKFDFDDNYYFFLNSPQYIGNLFKMDEKYTVRIQTTCDKTKETIKIDSFINLVPREKLDKVVDYDISSIKENLKSLYMINRNVNDVSSYINDYLLSVLNIYDESFDYKFLELSKSISELILQHSTSTVYYINYYQILKRIRELSIIEKQELKKLLENKESLIAEVCLKIILEEDISPLIDQLDDDTKMSLQSWPIYNLYNT